MPGCDDEVGFTMNGSFVAPEQYVRVNEGLKATVLGLGRVFKFTIGL